MNIILLVIYSYSIFLFFDKFNYDIEIWNSVSNLSSIVSRDFFWDILIN